MITNARVGLITYCQPANFRFIPLPTLGPSPRQLQFFDLAEQVLLPDETTSGIMARIVQFREPVNASFYLNVRHYFIPNAVIVVILVTQRAFLFNLIFCVTGRTRFIFY